MLTLHLARNTVALAAHIALEETGLDHALAWLDFSGNEQTGAAYLAVNPRGRVPALSTPEGVLTETPAILDYIAALAPEAGLMPTAPWAAARVREAMGWLAATAHVNHAHKYRGTRWTDDPQALAALRAHVPVTMTAVAAELEARLADCPGPWLFAAPTIADFHLHAVARWLPGDEVDLAPFPRLRDHGAAVAARPAAARALAMHDTAA